MGVRYTHFFVVDLRRFLDEKTSHPAGVFGAGGGISTQFIVRKVRLFSPERQRLITEPPGRSFPLWPAGELGFL
jgi:hypothetical protein